MMDLIEADDYNAPREYLEMLGKAVHNLDAKICEIVGTVDSMELLNETEVYRA